MFFLGCERFGKLDGYVTQNNSEVDAETPIQGTIQKLIMLLKTIYVFFCC